MQPDVLKVSGLHSGYGRIPVLFGVDFHLTTGEFLGILGHNGMGKSTLLKTLAGHLPATAGTVDLGGEDISRLPPARRARLGLGYVPQGRHIFPALTVLENLRVATVSGATAKDGERIIAEVLEELPRLKPVLGRPGGVLSGGEQQILALARCLCASPKVLLLDEPTEGIQPSIIDEMKVLLRALSASRQLSIVLVEQNLDFIGELAQRILVIRRGVLSADLDRSSLQDLNLAGEFTVPKARVS